MANKKEVKYLKVPNPILRMKELSSNGKLILAEMLSLSDDNFHVTGKTENYFVASLGITRKTVNNSIHKLVDLGFITIGKKKGEQREINTYIIDWDKIESYATERDYYTVFQDTSEEVKEQLNREEQQKSKTLNRGSERDNGQYDERGAGEKEINNFNEDETEETESYKNFEEPTDFIADNINRVLIPYLQKNGTRYYEEIDSLTKEALGRYPQLMKFDVMGMIEDALTRNKMKQTN